MDNCVDMRHREAMDDPYALERFVVEQNQADQYNVAVKELLNGRKQTHWIWYVFPQMLGLGSSTFATKYGISSGEEAAAYLRHEVLGPRLRQCTKLLLRSPVMDPTILMGSSGDATKLKSSMTLFAEVADDGADFVAVLRKYFHGGRDLETLKILKATGRKTTTELNQQPTSRARGFWTRWRWRQ